MLPMAGAVTAQPDSEEEVVMVGNLSHQKEKDYVTFLLQFDFQKIL